MLSINARLTLAASLVLMAFLGLTGLALERAFRDAGLAAVQERLQGQVYTLLAAAELLPDGRLSMPGVLPDARLSSPDSGLYARIVDADGGVRWASPSLLGLRIPYPAALQDGVAVFAPVTAGDGRELYALSFAVLWETAEARSRRLGFQVAESRAILDTQVGQFRRSLWGWLGAAALALLLAQGLVLRFGLAPLRRLGVELAAIESGNRARLSAGYPRELLSLTRGINAFIDSSRHRLERSRDALAELAHSLKTPLAVLRSLLDGGAEPRELRDTLAEQTARMHRTIDFQLQRAAASGPTPLAPAVEVATVLRRLSASMSKVYAHKKLRMDLDPEPGVGFQGDEGDLIEILGNLLDNACKWAGGRVRVRAGMGGHGETPSLLLQVEDDGPGIPAGQQEAVLARGVRVDAAVPGHGIGLAVVRHLVADVYAGQISIGVSELGGTRVEVRIPEQANRPV